MATKSAGMKTFRWIGFATCLAMLLLVQWQATLRSDEGRDRERRANHRDRGGQSDGREPRSESRDRERDREHEDERDHESHEHGGGGNGGGGNGGGGNGGGGNGSYVVLGYNDLGMHCMNQDFSRLCILPPYNNLHAQVIRRGMEPKIVTSGVDVSYRIPSNTRSSNKTNFWLWAPALFGQNLPEDVGLTGNGLHGTMRPTGQNDWAATGIPVTPIDDSGALDPYPISEIEVSSGGTTLATTHAVVPVSWEISCNLCHAPGQSGAESEFDILMRHDQKHQTHLVASANNSEPVLCASCHADPALGTNGSPGVKSLSQAMHGSHATRMAPVASLGNTCYACHPGFQTNCQRDVHFARGVFCQQCHGDMAAVANPSRTPWVSQPTCGSCHQQRRRDFEFEEPGKLFKDSHGHGNVHCSACHGSPHAIGPAVTAQDNLQAIEHQGFAGTISKCTVCHTTMPRERFEHKRD